MRTQMFLQKLRNFAIVGVFTLLMLAYAGNVLGQSTAPKCPVMPAGFLCITQAAGNAAAENVRELAATKAANAELKQALVDKDKNAEEIKATAAKNEADLKAANTQLLIDIAKKTGEIIKCDAYAVRDASLIEFLVKNQRSKQNGLFNVKLGGN